MKKYLSILMVIAVLFSFAACSNNAKIMDLKQQQIQQKCRKQKIQKHGSKDRGRTACGKNT